MTNGRSVDSMAKPNPEAAGYRPVLFEGDFKKIGREVNKNPTPELFGYEPEPDDVAGERAFVMQRQNAIDLELQARSGHNAAWSWPSPAIPVPPGAQEIADQRAAELRAYQGGLPDAPADGAQATENGNRLPVRWT